MTRTAATSLIFALLLAACDDGGGAGDADVNVDSGDDADVDENDDGDIEGDDAGTDGDVEDADSPDADEDEEADACEDLDGDGHCSDDDCDDSIETGRTCFAGCLLFYADGDGDGHGDATTTALACVAPESYTTEATDCDDTMAGHWSDCGLCSDADGDDYGESCDLGLDCDDTVFTGASCHTGCGTYFVDRDVDGYGDESAFVIACELPVGYAELVGDCDDDAPDVYPGAVELCGDGVDNDCTGEDRPCPLPGDILITEVMQDPTAMGDAEGEWLELFNTTESAIDLQGLVLRDDDVDLHRVETPLVIEPESYVVLGRSATAAPRVDYVYDDFLLGNDDDEVVLATFGTDGTDGIELCGVRYDEGVTFPDPAGAAMSLDPRLFDLSSVTRGDSWCEARTPYGFGDLGTPGLSNDECLWPPRLDSVEPMECISGGGVLVTLLGAHFFDIATVSFDSESLPFDVTSPWTIETTAPPHAVGWVDVTVSNVIGSDSLIAGFLFTGTSDAVDACSVVSPTSTTTTVGMPTETLTGSVQVAGVTDGVGQGLGVEAQVGVGPIDSNPAAEVGWVWSSALYDGDDGTDDIYTSTLLLLDAGTYAFAFRFTVDSGLTYLYCDTDGSSALDPYDSAAQGTLTVDP